MTETAANLSYLDPATLASIAPLEMRARIVVEGLMTGLHPSPYFGYSVEFAQHRQYTAGDDIRHLDWKIMGKTDKLYLKQYQKETNLDLVLLIDSSGSMGYTSGVGADGTPWRKFDHASTVAAALAYLALRQQDRVSLVVFANEVRQTLRPSNSHGHWKAIVEALGYTALEDGASLPAAEQAPVGAMSQPEPGSELAAELSWSRATDLGRLFDQVSAQLTRRSLIVLLSDLFDDPASYEHGLARMRHRRHDVMVLQTLDDAELTFPFRSPSQFLGLELEGQLNLDPSALREAYLETLRAHLARVEELTRRFGFDYLLVNTSQPLGPPLSHFLARRSAMVSKGRAS
jgi:uncharacterized protein (DUF58 family)